MIMVRNDGPGVAHDVDIGLDAKAIPGKRFTLLASPLPTTIAAHADSKVLLYEVTHTAKELYVGPGATSKLRCLLTWTDTAGPHVEVRDLPLR